MEQQIDELIIKLANVESEKKFHNMYYGREGEPFRENLKQYLSEMVEIKPERLFVGEAAGPHGARRTGIPFTDEFTLDLKPLKISDKEIFIGEYNLPLKGKKV